MRFKPLLFLILFSLLLFSCASYTISEAREIITYPENGNKTPTKYSEILAEKEAVERKARETEEEKKRIEEATRINEYPEDLSSITLPFYYNPVKNNEAKMDGETITAILIPMGEKRLEEEALISIKNCISDIKGKVIALTGSMENRSRFSTLLSQDAITVEGGTIIFIDSYLKDTQEDKVTLQLSKDKDISLLISDQKPLLPGEGDVDEVLALVDSLQDRDIESLVEYVSQNDNQRKIFFLSSYAPSSTDWNEWTDYSYRKDHSFMISDTLSDLKWQDAFDAMRFNGETESGVTRRNGEIEERLDFIWSKGLIPTSSYTLPLENTELTAVVADFILL